MKLNTSELKIIYNQYARIIADRHSKYTSCIEDKC